MVVIIIKTGILSLSFFQLEGINNLNCLSKKEEER